MSEREGTSRLYDLYLEMTPDPAQRVPAYEGKSGPNLEDSIRMNRPDVWEEYQRRLRPPAQTGDGSLPWATLTPSTMAGGELRADYLAGFGNFEDIADPTFVDPGVVAEFVDRVPAAAPAVEAGGLPSSLYAARNILGERERIFGAPPQIGPVPGANFGDDGWADILASLGGGGGAPQVTFDPSLLQFGWSEQDTQMLNQELADIEARRLAGDVALRAAWGEIAATNTAAAEKARAMRATAGPAAASIWTDAEAQALQLAEERAREAGQFEGRAAIDVSPTAGAEAAAAFMRTQAPAAQRFAERNYELLGEDLDWLAAMAGAQEAAYRGDLRRSASVMSADRAADYNRRVMERDDANRRLATQLQLQAATTNAQLAASAQGGDPLKELADLVGSAAALGRPDALAAQLGIPLARAEGMIADFWAATEEAARIRREG